MEADAWGRVRATYHALREDRAALRHALERSMEFTRVAPEMESVYPGQYWWALLHALSDDDLGLSARADIAASRLVRTGFGDASLALVDAVVLGRQGRAAEACAAVERARTAIGERDWSWYGLRLVAEAAVRDGWGEPVLWLREAEAFFSDRGHGRVARECRTLLVAAGAPAVPTALTQQLAVGGRLVAPIGPWQDHQTLRRIVREGPKGLREENLCEVRFVPLVGEGGWPAG